VDVGASGGTHPAWRRIARFAIGVGFEPDSREIGALATAPRAFRRWILCNKVVVAEKGLDQVLMHMTKYPFCSSTLKPNEPALSGWAFADLFTTTETRRFPATTLAATLAEHGLSGADWLKCDTQGTDLRIFQSLSDPIRERVLAVEFEPGLIDAYHGEEKLHHVLAAMEREPFWLAALDVQGSPRGSSAMLEARLGARLARRYPRFGPRASICANAVYLHTVGNSTELDIRSALLLWVFASELRQPAFACEVAQAGARVWGDMLFEDLASESARQMRKAVWRAVAARLWEKLRGA
jgi:FkbM family methyltransferase